MNHLTDILMERLKNKGLPTVEIPWFLRDVTNTISDDPRKNLLWMNKQLYLLGWDEIELDYHTMQLIIACFEAEGLTGR